MMKAYQITAVRKMADKRELAKELEENLRAVDRAEMEGMGFSTKQGVEVSIYETCPVFVARTRAGKLIACWGLQVLMGKKENTYLIWALGTDEIQHYAKSFIKESRDLLNQWVERYGCLENTVACFNTNAIRWLKWMGAEFSEPYLMGKTKYMNFKLKRRD